MGAATHQLPCISLAFAAASNGTSPPLSVATPSPLRPAPMCYANVQCPMPPPGPTCPMPYAPSRTNMRRSAQAVASSTCSCAYSCPSSCALVGVLEHVNKVLDLESNPNPTPPPPPGPSPSRRASSYPASCIITIIHQRCTDTRPMVLQLDKCPSAQPSAQSHLFPPSRPTILAQIRPPTSHQMGTDQRPCSTPPMQSCPGSQNSSPRCSRRR